MAKKNVLLYLHNPRNNRRHKLKQNKRRNEEKMKQHTLECTHTGIF